MFDIILWKTVTGTFFDEFRTIEKYVMRVCYKLPNQKATFTLVKR